MQNFYINGMRINFFFLKRNVDIHDVEIQPYIYLVTLQGVTGEIHYVDAGYNKVGMPILKILLKKSCCFKRFFQLHFL